MARSGGYGCQCYRTLRQINIIRTLVPLNSANLLKLSDRIDPFGILSICIAATEISIISSSKEQAVAAHRDRDHAEDDAKRHGG